MNLNTSFDNVHYWNGQQWIFLPAWGRFFLNLGSIINPPPKMKVRIAVAVPARQFAAAFAAFGFVANQVSSQNNQVNIQDYFRYLCALENGTPVSYVTGSKKKEGIFCGCKPIHDETRLEIRVHSKEAGGLTHLVPEKDAFNVEVLSKKIDDLPKKQSGRSVDSTSLFAQTFAGENALPLDKQTHLEAVVLGHSKPLREEISETHISLKTAKNKFVAGTIQDVLRVHEYLGENEHYLSRVIPAYRSLLSAGVKELTPKLLVFDGATTFLKWRDYYRKSNWIVILDKTETDFREATAIFNQEYSKYGKNNSSTNSLDLTSDVIDTLYYHEPS